MSFYILFSGVIACVGYAFFRTNRKANALSRLSWEDLVAKLQPVPVEGITTVALDFLQPTRGQISIETGQLWTMIGGTDGLQKMRENAEVLVALAGYAQRWNFEESVVVAERMRRDAVALRRATFRLSLLFSLGYGKVRGPFNVQEAASAYYLMRQRLLALYETSHMGRYPALAAVS